MTNAIQKSLEENKAQILESLPKEFHDDFIESIATSVPATPLTVAEAKAEAITMIRDNPTIAAIEDAECVAIIENGDEFCPTIAGASDDELEKQKAQMFKENHVSDSA